ncbi:Caleosin related protein-domain-containing protein [Abortiporus biennis]|nr:Caleosin related protein-domain-containing protein [Abortiporus biennis]
MPANENGGITTAIPTVPVIEERKVWTYHKNVKEAGIARANLAVSEESPNGTTKGDYSNKHKDQTVLQQHVDFFDLNKDGIITPVETFLGFHAIGWSILTAILATFIIHSGFSYTTQNTWIPDPLFRIKISNIHRAKHGSDTGTYDSEGRYIPQKFEDFFSKYGERYPNGEWGITYLQTVKGVFGQRSLMDVFGIGANLFEWFAVWFTIWPADGVMTMEDIRGVYDGSYFHKKADELKLRHGSEGHRD